MTLMNDTLLTRDRLVSFFPLLVSLLLCLTSIGWIVATAHGAAPDPPREATRIEADAVAQAGPALERFLSVLGLPELGKEPIRREAEEALREKDRRAALRKARYPRWSPPAREALYPGTLLAGTGRAVLTPNLPNPCPTCDPAITAPPLSGYGDRFDGNFWVKLLYKDYFHSHLYAPSQGTMDDLYAKALVLDNGVMKIALVGIDTVGVSQSGYEGLLYRLRERGIEGFDRHNLLLSGSHTHSGPGAVATEIFYWILTADLFVEAAYHQFLDVMADAVEQAVTNLEPARLGIGVGEETTITRNRRGDEIIDPQVGVIKVTKLDGTPLAAAFNFGVHPVSLGPGNLQYSTDNVGYAERHVEFALGEGTTAIFFNGSQGDVSPKGSLEEVGETLGDKVLAVYDETPTDETVDLDSAFCLAGDYGQWSCLEPLEPATCRVGMLMGGTGQLTLPVDLFVEREGTNFLALRINDTVLATVPGEPIVAIGDRIKARAYEAGFAKAFVVSLAGGHLAYITDEQEYLEGGYEGALTLHGPTTGDVVVENLGALIDRIGLP